MAKLRVWYINNPPSQPMYFPVVSIKEAIAKIDELAKSDLENLNIKDNAMGLEEYDYVTCEWTEYYDEYGSDIDEIMEDSLDIP